MEICEYDLEGNYLRSFKDYKEAAEKLNTSRRTLQSVICRIKQGKQEYYEDKVWNIKVKLYQVNVLESEDIIFEEE